MGFLDKVFFWRKDDHKIDTLAHQDISGDPLGSDFLGEPNVEEKSAFPNQYNPEPPGLENPPRRPAAPQMQSRDMELISSKLDTLKAILGSLEQRMSNLEKAAGVEQKQRQRLW